FAQIRDRLLVVPAVEGHDIRSAAFRSLLLQPLQTSQFTDAWRGPGLEEIQDDVAPAHAVQREAFSAFILDDDVRGGVAAAAGNLGLHRMGSWGGRGKNVFVERRRLAAMARATGSSGSSARQCGKYTSVLWVSSPPRGRSLCRGT